MSGLQIQVNCPILPILTRKLVAMATCFEPLEKREPNLQSTIKYLQYGENLLKIGPVGHEFSLLKSLYFKKKTRKRGKAHRVAHPAGANTTGHLLLTYRLAVLLPPSE